ncbi:IS4/Tn5 family transposase DNA-binding protein [Cupriavidus sp. amp6]|uniref:Transposase Tn5-like N-terminal domain-containing protein n=1 Tax=Cupriavidus taiwanensis TaxID=164546 RepID=A0A375JEH1_9BURK|nr:MULTISPECIES: transposase [Cupriavidus]SPS02520.1 hypothetical protein CBM2634_U130011 [Cupriavidus taiwanensis]
MDTQESRFAHQADVLRRAWVDEECESLDLGDPRRNRRAKELLKRFAALPTASIPGACDDCSQTIKASRFVSNEQIDWPDVMRPHWERTTAMAGKFPVGLCHRVEPQWPGNGGAGAVELRNPAGDVSPSDLCGDARSRATGGDRCLDVDSRAEGCRRQS